jgi:post-segregation antitoxin (ccd killing protein)
MTLPRWSQCRYKKIFKNVKPIFRVLANHWPLFIHSQKIPGRPKENQLAKSETYHKKNQYQYHAKFHDLNHVEDIRRRTIKLSRLLKTGIEDAMIQATTQTPNAMANHEPTATTSRLCIRSVPAKTRTYIDLQAMWPMITPAIMICSSS